MKRFCIIDNDGKITNIIVAEETFAAAIGALPAYDDAKIGETYAPPEPEPAPPTEMEQLRADVDYLLMMQEG